MQRLQRYLKEREDFDCLLTDEGFASYKITGEECYIRDIWVEPDFRKTGAASAMADIITAIAKKSGCKFLSGSVLVTANHSTESTMVLLAYGFKIHSVVQYGIFFRKEI